MSTPKSSSSSPNLLVSTLPMSLTHSPSIYKSTTSKIDYLYEISYVHDESKITSKEFPLINSYHAFTKPSNPFTRSIKFLIRQSPRTVKLYVQSIKFDQCELLATS